MLYQTFSESTSNSRQNKQKIQNTEGQKTVFLKKNSENVDFINPYWKNNDHEQRMHKYNFAVPLKLQ